MVVACQIADLANEDTPQMYTLCGRGPRSSLRVLRHGLEVTAGRRLSPYDFLLAYTHV